MRTALLLLLLAAEGVQVTAYPPVATDVVHVTCRVPRDAANREVAWGVVDYTSSGRTLDGSSPTVYESWIAHPPCGKQEAFCVVLRSNAPRVVVRYPFEVVC